MPQYFREGESFLEINGVDHWVKIEGIENTVAEMSEELAKTRKVAQDCMNEIEKLRNDTQSLESKKSGEKKKIRSSKSSSKPKRK